MINSDFRLADGRALILVEQSIPNKHGGWGKDLSLIWRHSLSGLVVSAYLLPSGQWQTLEICYPGKWPSWEEVQEIHTLLTGSEPCVIEMPETQFVITLIRSVRLKADIHV